MSGLKVEKVLGKGERYYEKLKRDKFIFFFRYW